VREGCKGAERFKKEEEDAAKRAKNLEEAKGILIREDVSLPKAKLIKIVDGKDYRGSRVKINGWVHRLRRQGIAYCAHLLARQFGLYSSVIPVC
jgi:asparaginyl-tRNA synthetase